jgi:hypothetical protein
MPIVGLSAVELFFCARPTDWKSIRIHFDPLFSLFYRMSLCFTASALNFDHSNRHHSINDPHKCSRFGARLVAGSLEFPDVVVVSETNKTTSAALAKALPDYESVSSKLTYDVLQLLYDTRKFEPVGRAEVSVVGKYIVQRLKCVDTDETVALVGVHLPHTKDRAAALRALQKRSGQLSDDDDVAGVSIVGDFNTYPDEIDELFPDFDRGFCTENPTATTGRTPDNMLMWKPDGGDVRNARVYADCDKLKHYPIWAECA